MPNHQAIFIALEGADGSGKATQFNLLTERLRAVGYDVAVFDFPRYEEPSSHFVKKYLNGGYGPASEVNPYTASMFYALDRYEASRAVRQALAEGKIVLSNRYAGSNMAHQGSKFGSEAQQRGFFIWADSLEFQLLGIPRPDINVFLRVPAEISYKLIGKKSRRSYTSKSRDEHEADFDHLNKSIAAYDLLCRLFPRDFTAVDCVENEQLLGIPEISDRIWQVIQPILPTDLARHRPKAKTILLDVTPDNLAKTTSARLKPARPDKKISLSFKNASYLARRFIQKNDCQPASPPHPSFSRTFNYFLPESLNGKLANQYKNYMSLLLTNRRKLSSLLRTADGSNNHTEIEHSLMYLIPMAEQTTVEFSCSTGALHSLSHDFEASQLSELHGLAKLLADNGASSLAAPLAQPSKFLLKAVDSLPQLHSSSEEVISLNVANPRLEFDLLADILFEASDLSKHEIQEAALAWDYERKSSTLRSILDSSDGANKAMENLSYEWDLVSDGPTMDYLLACQSLQIKNIQPSSPRYGYDIPSVIETAGADGLFEACFDAALEIYSSLQAAGFVREAQYAVLHGHKQRWQVVTNYQQLGNLHAAASSKSAPAGLIPLHEAMFSLLAETHPILAESIVKKGPELTPKFVGLSPKKNPKISTKTSRPRKPKRRFKKKAS